MHTPISRWSVLTVMVVSLSAISTTGCKSGTNLVPLPKLPSLNVLGLGRKKPAESSLSSNSPASQLPPPSVSALTGAASKTASTPALNSAAAAGRSAPAYHNTGLSETRPRGLTASNYSTGPYNTGTSTASHVTASRGSNPMAASTQQGLYSPNYTQKSQSGSYGSGVSYGRDLRSHRGGERVASRFDQYGASSYGSKAAAPYRSGRAEEGYGYGSRTAQDYGEKSNAQAYDYGIRDRTYDDDRGTGRGRSALSTGSRRAIGFSSEARQSGYGNAVPNEDRYEDNRSTAFRGSGQTALDASRLSPGIDNRSTGRSHYGTTTYDGATPRPSSPNEYGNERFSVPTSKAGSTNGSSDRKSGGSGGARYRPGGTSDFRPNSRSNPSGTSFERTEGVVPARYDNSRLSPGGSLKSSRPTADNHSYGKTARDFSGHTPSRDSHFNFNGPIER